MIILNINMTTAERLLFITNPDSLYEINTEDV